ncbi:TSUP family transporter [Leptobacterium flavescens]|uniref:Probable membrane transporter protein n=1 Tax=Leptobacterium flavescens TaxID=472055 RepID=A0A6P0UTK5_9FLAO|nr:sulfite exporter TauE/SafE family protein [Leptobacterium flavescens]NER15338.1 TSUP family transporter [Leptobacterium flavescens]
MEIENILGYIGALFIGGVLGLVGGGGSILTVPLLVYLLSYSPVVATAYSLFVVGASAVAGAIQKYRKGVVDIKTGLFFSFPSFLAVYLSRKYAVPGIPDVLFSTGGFTLTKNMGLMLFFAVVMLFAATAMIKPKKENGKTEHSKPSYPFIFMQGIIIGTITGIIGAGGGFLYVPALVLWTNLPMKKAVGTSLIIVAINSLIGFTGDLQEMKVDWSFLLPFTFITIMGILLGGYLSKFVSNKSLKKSFGWFILVMAIYIISKEILNS